MLLENGLVYFKILLLLIILAAAVGSTYFILNNQNNKYYISDDGIKKMDFISRIFIPWESITEIKTNIKSPYASIYLYYKKDGIIDSMGIKSSENLFSTLRSTLLKKKINNMDKLSYYAINENNFEKALYILLSEEYRWVDKDSRDDLYDEEMFLDAVESMTKPDAAGIRKINYIINDSIKNPDSIALVDDFTGIISSGLWKLGYEVTSIQHTKAAVEYALNQAEYEKSQPKILSVENDEIKPIMEHDAALIVYPLHSFYDENEIRKLLSGLMINIKQGGGLFINNEMLGYENASGYFADDNGRYLNEPVIGKKYSRKIIGDFNFVNSYIEVGFHSLNTYMKISKKRIWKDVHLIQICEDCGFKFIRKIEDSSYLLFTK